MVYSETGTINAAEIAKDLVSALSDDLNSDVTHIDDTNLNPLAPFITQGWEMAADILFYAVEIGDTSQKSWAVGLLPSEDATTPDGKPVLFLEQQAALTSNDLSIRVEEPNIVPPFSIEED